MRRAVAPVRVAMRLDRLGVGRLREDHMVWAVALDDMDRAVPERIVNRGNPTALGISTGGTDLVSVYYGATPRPGTPMPRQKVFCRLTR